MRSFNDIDWEIVQSSEEDFELAYSLALFIAGKLNLSRRDAIQILVMRLRSLRSRGFPIRFYSSGERYGKMRVRDGDPEYADIFDQYEEMNGPPYIHVGIESEHAPGYYIELYWRKYRTH